MKTILALATAFLLLSGFTHTVCEAQTQADIREIQQRLKDAGLDPGVVDGILGSKTKVALRQYQSQHALPVTGLPDKATLEALQESSKTAQPLSVTTAADTASVPAQPKPSTEQLPTQELRVPSRSDVEQVPPKPAAATTSVLIGLVTFIGLAILIFKVFQAIARKKEQKRKELELEREREWLRSSSPRSSSPIRSR